MMQGPVAFDAAMITRSCCASIEALLDSVCRETGTGKLSPRPRTREDRLSRTVCSKTPKAFSGRICFWIKQAIKRRLRRPTHVQAGGEILPRVVDDARQFSPVINVFKGECFHGSPGHDESVERVAYLTPSPIEPIKVI